MTKLDRIGKIMEAVELAYLENALTNMEYETIYSGIESAVDRELPLANKEAKKG